MANIQFTATDGTIITGKTLASAQAQLKAHEARLRMGEQIEDALQVRDDKERKIAEADKAAKPKAVFSEDKVNARFHAKSKRITMDIDVSREDVFSKAGRSHVWNSRKTIETEYGTYVVQVNTYKKILGAKAAAQGVEVLDD